MVDIVIHIGLHKTGTTFLQKKIFPNLNNVNYISIFTTKIIGNKNYILCEKLSNDRLNLISDEALSGIPYDSISSASRFEIADRLKRLFPNAKIIVTFRNKEDWIKSVYKQYTKRDREKTGLKFNEWYDSLFDKSLLNFETYENYLKQLFKEVLVLQYEDLKSNPDEYIQKICTFINVPLPEYDNFYINKSRSEIITSRTQKLNALFEKLNIPYPIRWIIRRFISEIN